MKRPAFGFRRSLFFAALVMLLLIFVATALAAPSAQEQKPVIAQPDQDSAVRGVVSIVGSATHPQFQRYELYYVPWPVPSDNAWIFIGDAHFQQQPLGLLGTWNTGALQDGPYGLRVRVVKADGNYLDSDPRRVVVANIRQLETPTPAVTSTPSEPTTEPTPLPPTATIIVALPTFQTPRTAATEAPQTAATSISGGASSRGGSSSASANLVDGTRLIGTARKAALYTAGLFVALGLFFGVKAILVWLWHRIRP